MIATLKQEGGFYGWVIVVVAALISFFGMGMIVSFGVFLPTITGELGWGRGVVSGAYMAVFIVAGLSSPFVGWFVGKYGARLAIVLGAFLCALGFVSLSFHSRIWQFYTAYGLFIGLGFSFSGFIPITALANDWFERKKSLALGIILASGGLGGALMIPGIMVLINSVGWRPTYLVMAAFAFVFILLIPGIAVRNKPQDLGQMPDGAVDTGAPEQEINPTIQVDHMTGVDFTVNEAMRTLCFWLLVGFGVTQVFAYNMLVTHQVAFMIDRGFSSALAAASLSLIPGMGIAGKLGAGIFGLRFDNKAIAFGSTVLMAVGVTVIVVSNTLYLIFAAAILFGFGAGASLVAMTALYPIYFGKNNYPEIMGSTLPFVKILGGAAAPVGGFLYDATGSYMIPFVGLIFVVLGGLVCLSLAIPPLHFSMKEGFLEA